MKKGELFISLCILAVLVVLTVVLLTPPSRVRRDPNEIRKVDSNSIIVGVAPAAPFMVDDSLPPLRVRSTSYCACKICCGKNARGVTFTGRPVSYNGGHFVAADPKVIPLGSWVAVPGYAGGRMVPVIDTGSAIKGNRIDLFFPDHEEAKAWGVKWVNIKRTSGDLP